MKKASKMVSINAEELGGLRALNQFQSNRIINQEKALVELEQINRDLKAEVIKIERLSRAEIGRLVMLLETSMTGSRDSRPFHPPLNLGPLTDDEVVSARNSFKRP